MGFAADRLAARWPAHEDAATRPIDWRSAVVVAWGGISFAALAVRWSDPFALGVLVLYFSALLVLLATDLDQRLLPDRITLPLLAFALLLLLSGRDPLLADRELGVLSGLAAGLAAPLVLAVTNLVLRGGLGLGDLKLSVGLGLMSGLSRLFTGFLIASALSSVVLVALLVTRRLGRRSPIPFGPILIAGGMIAALVR